MPADTIETLRRPFDTEDADGPHEAVPGVFTPQGEALCYPCHGPEFPSKTLEGDEWDEATTEREPDESEGFGICSNCGDDIVIRIGVAKLSRIAHAADVVDLTQTGGMCAGLDGETSTNRYVQLFDDPQSYDGDGPYVRGQIWECDREGYDRHYDNSDEFGAAHETITFESEREAIEKLAELPPRWEGGTEDEASRLEDRIFEEIVVEQGITLATKIVDSEWDPGLLDNLEGYAVAVLFFDDEVPDGLRGWIEHDDEADEIDRVEWSSGESYVFITP